MCDFTLDPEDTRSFTQLYPWVVHLLLGALCGWRLLHARGPVRFHLGLHIPLCPRPLRACTVGSAATRPAGAGRGTSLGARTCMCVCVCVCVTLSLFYDRAILQVLVSCVFPIVEKTGGPPYALSPALVRAAAMHLPKVVEHPLVGTTDTHAAAQPTCTEFACVAAFASTDDTPAMPCHAHACVAAVASADDIPAMPHHAHAGARPA